MLLFVSLDIRLLDNAKIGKNLLDNCQNHVVCVFRVPNAFECLLYSIEVHH